MSGTLRQDLSILDTLETEGSIPEMEDALMPSQSKSRWSKRGVKPRSRKRYRRRRRERDLGLFPEDDDLLDASQELDAVDRDGSQVLDSEERRYRNARMLAEDQAELLLRAGKVGVVVVLLLVFLSPIGVVAFIYWCIRFGRRLIKMMIEPRLRERLVEERMEQHIHANVSRERREIAGDHAHSLEVLSASIAHEIRNPITAAKTSTTVALGSTR